MNDRPQTLREIATRAENLSHFGHEFADWLHTLRTLRTRPQLAAAIAGEPALLRKRFPEGAVSDAWLAAYAEHLAQQTGLVVPAWTRSAKRIAPEPWFSTESAASRQRRFRNRRALELELHRHTASILMAR